MRYDLRGERFGKLVISDLDPSKKNGRLHWFCECDCGNNTIVPTYRLTSGETKSCGCLKRSRFDLTGKTYGKLTVLRKDKKKSKHDAVLWQCKCDCGMIVKVSTSHLRSGSTKSCGMHKGTHRQSIENKGTPEYKTWLSMRNRCNNENNERYKDYGGRGIKICDRWDDFENFYYDMGKKPSPEHSIERIHNNKGYNPDNCVWADAKTQNRNTRTRITNTSGVSGVHWRKDINKWVARISVDYKRIHLGAFNNLEDAKKARNEAEIKYWKKHLIE